MHESCSSARWIGFTGTALPRARGVGTIGIAEFDEVDMSNLQRQVIHGRSDVGRPKALSAKESILEINEHVDVRLHEFRLDNSNAVELFSEYDLILDGTDNFATRYLVNDAAVIAGKPYVWGLDLPLRRAGLGLLGRRPPGRRGTELSRSLPGAPPPGMVPSCAEVVCSESCPRPSVRSWRPRRSSSSRGGSANRFSDADDLRRTCDDVPDDPPSA